VIAILILFMKFIFQRSSAGISGGTQILYAMTYTLRYTDFWLFGSWISNYNSAMKIFYMAASFLTVVFIYGVHRKTYQANYDKLRPEMLIIPVTVLAFVINHETTFPEVCWTWSIYMEAVALLPQYYMIWNGSHLDYGLVTYLIAMGGYRGMYILNWLYRYNTENYFDMIAVVGGVIETSIAVIGLLAVIFRNISKYSNVAGVMSPSVYTIPSAIQVFENSFNQMKNSDSKADCEVLIHSNTVVSPK